MICQLSVLLTSCLFVEAAVLSGKIKNRLKASKKVTLVALEKHLRQRNVSINHVLHFLMALLKLLGQLTISFTYIYFYLYTEIIYICSYLPFFPCLIICVIQFQPHQTRVAYLLVHINLQGILIFFQFPYIFQLLLLTNVVPHLLDLI